MFIQLRVGHVTFHRQQTAPSIPMPGQNYGYEEIDDGTLKPQIIPAIDSSMGPAYYNVSYVSVCMWVCGVHVCMHAAVN